MPVTKVIVRVSAAAAALRLTVTVTVLLAPIAAIPEDGVMTPPGALVRAVHATVPVMGVVPPGVVSSSVATKVSAVVPAGTAVPAAF